MNIENVLCTKFLRIPNFYLLPKIHKHNKPERPILNDMSSITEKIATFIDEHIRPLVPQIPSYVTDTSHILKLLRVHRLHNDDLLVTTDASSLYTNIPHNEGIAAIKKV